MSLTEILGRPLSRRTFTKTMVTAAVVGSQAALWLPKSLEEVAEEEHRVWALGEVKAAVAETVGWGYLVTNGNGLHIITQDISAIGSSRMVTGRRVEGDSMDIARLWHGDAALQPMTLRDEFAVSGPCYVEVINEDRMPKLGLLVPRSAKT